MKIIKNNVAGIDVSAETLDYAVPLFVNLMALGQNPLMPQPSNTTA